jgi:hypothetical protein
MWRVSLENTSASCRNEIKKAPQKHLTDDHQHDAKEQGRVTQSIAPIARRSELQNAESERSENDGDHRIQRAYQGFKRWLSIIVKDFRRRVYRVPFILEVIGLIILGVYTYQARRANQLTQEVVRSTVSPSVFCAVSASFGHRGGRDVPMTGGFFVTCNNQGKITAQKVSGVFTLIAKSFPDERILYSETWLFGGNDATIFGNDSVTWPFHTPNYSPETEPERITAGKEIIIGKVVLSFADETGETVTRRFCFVEMNWANLGGSPDSWATCPILTAEKEMLANPRKPNH